MEALQVNSHRGSLQMRPPQKYRQGLTIIQNGRLEPGGQAQADSSESAGNPEA